MEWDWGRAAVGGPPRKGLWRHILRGQNLAACPEESRDQSGSSQTGRYGLVVNCPSSELRAPVRLREQPTVPSVVLILGRGEFGMRMNQGHLDTGT